ncbi:major facilitator superfamily domain-containing protein 8-like isoform X1 [Clytia hemisphaerica]|uniref:Major facilitator superfamily (MFS) profile domain-containing protein n=2 Tax=Clytia hemisphaerica TaxID=252671 RepID=A0A7M5U398_9CNID
MSSDDDEKDPLIAGSEGINYDSTISKYTRTPSVESYILTDKERKRSIRVIYANAFIGSISFSIVMASLWPFLQKLDHEVSESFLGWVNAGYSFAQMVSGIFMGYWCEKRNAKEPIFVSIILLAAGSLLYSYAETFGKKGIWVVLGGRVLLGTSAGVVAVSRAVGAQLSTLEERSGVMAQLALWQAIGFSIGPAFQAMAKPIGSNEYEIKAIKMYINVFTLPGFFMIILSIINFVLVALYFKENVHAKEKMKKESRRLRRQSTSFEPLDTTIVFTCLLLWFIALSIFALNETILSPVVMNEYAWTRKQTVFNTSILLSVAGVIAIICFLAIAPLEKKFGGKNVLAFGYFLMLVGFVIYLPWGPGYPKLTHEVLNFQNGTQVVNEVVEGDGGCPYHYDWCRNTPKLHFAQFLTAATLVGIGYPIAAVLLSTLYSKVIGPFPQGKYMGWLTGTGSLARVVGPIYVTAVYQKGGIRWTSVSICLLLTITMCIFAFFWKRLVPYNERFRTKSRLSSVTA